MPWNKFFLRGIFLLGGVWILLTGILEGILYAAGYILAALIGSIMRPFYLLRRRP